MVNAVQNLKLKFIREGGLLMCNFITFPKLHGMAIAGHLKGWDGKFPSRHIYK
jgi:hypothetical protein